MFDWRQPEPMFVMSMFANKADLYEAKAKYYMEKAEWLQHRLNIIDPDGETLDMVYDSHGEVIEYG